MCVISRYFQLIYSRGVHGWIVYIIWSAGFIVFNQIKTILFLPVIFSILCNITMYINLKGDLCKKFTNETIVSNL